MPSLTAQTTKATAREALMRRVQGEVTAGAATGNGNAGGTTFPDTGMSTYGDDFYNDWYVLLTSGTYVGQWRKVADFTQSTGTFTVDRAFGGQVASGVTYQVYKHNPGWYTEALRLAAALSYPGVHKPADFLVVPDEYEVGQQGTPSFYVPPTAVRDVWGVKVDTGSVLVEDWFTRADSTSAPGNGWEASSGDTYGISSNRLYCVSNADGDICLRSDTGLLFNGFIQCDLAGTLNHASTYSAPALIFRYVDASNYMYVRLQGTSSQVQLHQVVAGTDTKASSALASATLTLADATTYRVQVVFRDLRVQVWVDGVQYIDYTVTGNGLGLMRGGNHGMRLDKANSPATAATWDNYRAHALGLLRPVGQWRWEPPFIKLGAPHHRSHVLHVDGTAPLTGPALDTTYGTLATDTTAVLELATTDPAWELFLTHAERALYEIAARPGNVAATDDRNLMAQNAAEAMQKLRAPGLAGLRPMTLPAITAKHPRY